MRIGRFHHEQGRADRPNAGNFGQSLTTFVVAMPFHQLRVDPFDLALELRIFLSLQRKKFARQFGYRFIFRDALEKRYDATCTRRRGDAELRAIPSYSVDELGALLNKPFAHPDQHERGLLFCSLYRNEAHCWAAHRFAESFGIRSVVLAALDVGLR
ncbi:hypothetical protein sphantq_00460 [Sphingobium sp. AntQ-1]|uniref:Uncharacterized protein n=1 Tax=Sphingobium yanoikuyae ATCC 51230 TaxID=883163 RepID=K9CQW7_SPHYA|nr:hypothetical protein HMPREF9718_03810 [Sphingobium yanoikuyae ATCC 51230]WCP12063.1 hypothetical protein sphantq_00460 [Sphingobium sp. AntQ-1]